MTSTKSIVETASANGRFKNFVAAITAADLLPTMSGAGPFTVFAPSDDAFAKMPAGALDGLLKPESKAKLTELLKFHVISGSMPAGSLAGKQTDLASLQGQSLHVDGRDGVKVNSAKVTTSDVACSNGVIHIIDAVLTPKAS
ncbi:MAG: fasciclin domain-containing protein [Parvularculaceae bacterium]|nr:fasciclin domain-containing protein [Parvularculaceae bacterium]